MHFKCMWPTVTICVTQVSYMETCRILRDLLETYPLKVLFRMRVISFLICNYEIDYYSFILLFLDELGCGNRVLQKSVTNNHSWQHKIKIIFCSYLKAELGSKPQELSLCCCLEPQLGLSNLPGKKALAVLNIQHSILTFYKDEKNRNELETRFNNLFIDIGRVKYSWFCRISVLFIYGNFFLCVLFFSLVLVNREICMKLYISRTVNRDELNKSTCSMIPEAW